MGSVVQFDRRLSEQTRRDEARMEAIVAFDKVVDFAVRGAPQLQEWLGNLIELGQYMQAAKEEVLGLGGDTNDAA